jgi:hypothetical protein
VAPVVAISAIIFLGICCAFVLSWLSESSVEPDLHEWTYDNQNHRFQSSNLVRTNYNISIRSQQRAPDYPMRIYENFYVSQARNGPDEWRRSRYINDVNFAIWSLTNQTRQVIDDAPPPYPGPSQL